MAHEQMIRLKDDAPGVRPESREPTVGAWYCGMDTSIDARTGEGFELGGELMRYEGEGVWSCDPDDGDRDPEPGEYEYLQEQV
jgi:hypothetical protein